MASQPQLRQESVRFATRAYRDVKALYMQAFPKEERIAFVPLVLNSYRRDVSFRAFYDGERFAGLLYSIMSDDMAYALFLAVNPDARSRGYGSQILSVLAEEAGERAVLLDIEPVEKSAENYEQRVRRLSFYNRNGFSYTGFTNFDGVCKYWVMSTRDFGDEFPLEGFKALMDKLFCYSTKLEIERDPNGKRS